MQNFVKILALATITLISLSFAGPVLAQDEVVDPPQSEEFQALEKDPPTDYFKAKVIEIVEEGEDRLDIGKQQYQILKLELTSGPDEGGEVELKHLSTFGDFKDYQRVSEGDEVILVRTTILDEEQYFVAEKYRTSSVILIFALFFVLILIFAGLKGVGSLAGLAFSILVVSQFIIPNIVDGRNPLVISIVGAVVIAIVTIYLAHGFSRRTTIALISTLISIFIAAFLATFFVSTAKLFGVGTEEAYYLQQGALADINLRGLLLGGIIIGTLGILDDVTTAQAAAVDEILKANPKLKFKELYKRGLSVGREHIASLVNTLALVYVGAALPLFLIFVANEAAPPLWVAINNEFIVEEVVRTLVGSTALVLAVPIATFMAARFLIKPSS